MTDSAADPVLAIGAMSRASGLTVSALRFYDRESVLVPARTDPSTGYRRYHRGQLPRAGALAQLRLTGMSLLDLSAALDALDDADALGGLLAAHRERLSAAHDAALRALDRVERQAKGGVPVGITVPLDRLHAALDAVRHAMATDPDPLPVLTGVLLDRDVDGVRAVATDRYRLAHYDLEVAGGEPAQVVLPPELVAALVEGADEQAPDAPTTVRVTGDRVSCQVGDRVHESALLEGDYPDHRSLLPPGPGAEDAQDVADLLKSLLAGGAPAAAPADGSSRGRWALRSDLLVDHGYLWDAVSEVRDGRVVLPSAGVASPVILRSSDERLLSLIMPIRPDDEEPDDDEPDDEEREDPE